MKTFEILYSRDTSSIILQWLIVVDTDDSGVRIMTNYGVIGSNGTTYTKYVKEGKNIGKSNETTPYEQAVKEAKAKWSNQKKKGYKSLKDLDIEPHMTDNKLVYYWNGVPVGFKLEEVLEKALPKNNTDANNNIKPMKAHPYYNAKILFPCYVQPKLNGVRATLQYKEITEGEGLFAKTVNKWVLLSKEGNVYHLPHITDNDWIEGLDKSIVYDGELYVHGELLQNIRRRIPIMKDGILSHASLSSDVITFVIFDIINTIASQRVRIKTIQSLDMFLGNDRSIRVLETKCVKSYDQAIVARDMYIEDGYEGAILRNIDGRYKPGKRSTDLAKLKRFSDAEFKIIDIVEETRTINSLTINFILKNDVNDLIFKSVPLGDYQAREYYLEHKKEYIGKYATVKFAERSADRLPLHSNVITIRDYE